MFVGNIGIVVIILHSITPFKGQDHKSMEAVKDIHIFQANKSAKLGTQPTKGFKMVFLRKTAF